MFLKALAFVIGILELLFTRPFVDTWMNAAAVGENVELRSWVYTAARLEGVVFILWALKGCCSGSEE